MSIPFSQLPHLCWKKVDPREKRLIRKLSAAHFLDAKRRQRQQRLTIWDLYLRGTICLVFGSENKTRIGHFASKHPHRPLLTELFQNEDSILGKALADMTESYKKLQTTNGWISVKWSWWEDARQNQRLKSTQWTPYYHAEYSESMSKVCKNGKAHRKGRLFSRGWDNIFLAPGKTFLRR